MYQSLSRKDLEERFKPISLPSPSWPFKQTLIRNIVKRQTTPTGKVIYLVRFKDGQTRKISASDLNESHKQLVEDFELEIFRSNERPTLRRKATLKRKSTQSPPFRSPLKKKVRFETKSDSSDSMSNFIVNSSEEEDSEMTQDQPLAITRSGRQTNRKVTFENEFYPNGVKLKTKTSTYTYSVPLYENSDFIKNHSEHCFRCDGTGYYNGSVEVPIGNLARRMRLLLCKTCSYSVHNNCLPNGRGAHHFINGEYQCSRCSGKKSVCQYDRISLTKKTDGEIPFRCNACHRGFHQKCIAKGVSSEIAEQFKEVEMDDLYAKGLCIECTTFGVRPGNPIGERIVDNKKELLIKWKNTSHRHTNWVSENWFEHSQQFSYKAYLRKKLEPNFEGLTSIPIEWKTVDRILNVEWENKSNLKAKRILAVYKDISYEDAVWDDPPNEDDTELYPDYKLALERHLQATRVTPPQGMPQLIENVRRMAMKEGYEKHEFKSQPDFMTGGTLMKHQLEALNWLLYQWERKQSCILADDMGLGKTIQIIGYLYALFKKYKIYPFVIVVPNSTATNWVREFQKWAPDMTVAPYFGGQTSRKLALDNEILDKNRRLKCHVVVATYESSLDYSELHRIFWAVMVVDESQRLKNDQSLLFRTLKQYKVDQISLLTGTPLQNNLKELFNIMNFIQPDNFHGSEAELYADMTQAKIEDLHERLRPHFLRRTKEEVLKSLPPKYELIVPLSMTPIQKEVYKDCLNRDIYETLSRATGSKVQRGLTSIFMNLRKVLNHPYLLDGVERIQKTPAETQTAMINACEKLKVFHQMLPKLKAQGHRVLIFSTMTRTLDVLEDYFNYEKIRYTRIDGSCNERSRVRSIDAFNAPNSKLDVFLLSTRAGGVGINLATADTIVIWDSDFNPYADLQAISRAHRIGQSKMVLILRFMTRLSIEEKVLQIGKGKMALEHVVVERMKENSEESYDDMESILKFGSEALFSDDNSQDIHYDSAALDSLLDREKYRDAALKAQEEEVAAAEGRASEQGLNFSFAKVWKKDGSLVDIESDEKNGEKEEDFWQKFLKQKEIEEAEKRKREKLEAESLGRGARKRVAVTYTENHKTAVEDKHEMDAYVPMEDDKLADDDIDVINEESKPRLIRINGPRKEPKKLDNNTAQIQQYMNIQPQQFNAQASTSQIQLLPPQQIPLYQPQAQPNQQQVSQEFVSCLSPNYEQDLYNEMWHVSQPIITKLKAVATKAYNDKKEHSPEYRICMDNLSERLYQHVDAHFKLKFLNRFRNGEAMNVDRHVISEIYRCENVALQNTLRLFMPNLTMVMAEHIQKEEMRSKSGNISRQPGTQQQEKQVIKQTNQTQSTETSPSEHLRMLIEQRPQKGGFQPSVPLTSQQQMLQGTTFSSHQQAQRAQPTQMQQSIATSTPLQAQQGTMPSSIQYATQNVNHSVQRNALSLQQQQRQFDAQQRFQIEQLIKAGQLPRQELVNPFLQGSENRSQQMQSFANEKALQQFKERALQEAKEIAKREAYERRVQEMARQLKARSEQERAERDRVEQEKAHSAAKEARERAEREQIQRFREQAVYENRKRAEREARERAEREARERAEHDARMRAEREAREQTERKAREQAEQQKRDQTQREALENAQREQSTQLLQMQEHLQNEQAAKPLQSSSSTPQLPEVMTPSMIMSLSNHFSEHGVQNISSQDFLAFINKIAQKEAEEKRKEAEEKRRLEFLASQRELQEKRAKIAEEQRRQEAQTFNDLRMHMMSSNLQRQQQQQQQQQNPNDQIMSVDPDLLARSNAALFKNMSSEVQMSMFSKPPAQPDKTFLDQFEKSTSPLSTPSSPAKLSYPTDQNNKNS